MGQISGGKMQSAPRPKPGFTCPACGAQNPGLLEDGCPACGNGTNNAKHIGLPEPPPKPTVTRTPPAVPVANVAKLMTADYMVSRLVAAIEEAWQAWHARFPELQDARTAFYAGYEAGGKAMAADVDADASPLAVGEIAPEIFEGSIEVRTITAALQYFRDAVLVMSPEECQSGEWLTADKIDELIGRLQTTAPVL